MTSGRSTHPRRRSRSLCATARPVMAIVLGLLALLGLTGPAHAHNTLRSSDPADGSTVTIAPGSVTLTFDQPAIALGTLVHVLGPGDLTVSAGDAVLVDSSVTQPLTGDLPAGLYTVHWRVTSADGHPLEGQVTFTAAAPATVNPATGTSTPVVETPPGTETSQATPTAGDAISTDPTSATPSQPGTTDDPTAGATFTGTSYGIDLPVGAVVGGAVGAAVLLAAAGVIVVRRSRPV